MLPQWHRPAGALSALALVCDIAAAQDQKKAETTTDADLLEFLGSVDSGADSQAAADDGSGLITWRRRTSVRSQRRLTRMTLQASNPRREHSLLRPETKK